MITVEMLKRKLHDEAVARARKLYEETMGRDFADAYQKDLRVELIP